MRYQSGLKIEKPTKLTPEQVERFTKLITQTRAMATTIGLTKNGLAEVVKICNKILAIEAEIDSRVRNIRTLQLGDFKPLEGAIESATKLIKKDLPGALMTLSAFVDKRATPLATLISEEVEELVTPPKKPSRPTKKDPPVIEKRTKPKGETPLNPPKDPNV